MDHQEYLHWTYFGDAAMDSEEFRRFPELLGDAEVFVDVGASHGVYTHYALRHLRAGRIIAVEPDPDRFAELEANVATWLESLERPDVALECLQCVLSDPIDAAGGDTTDFFVTGTQISGGLFSVDERSDEYRAIAVAQATLDDVVDGSRPTLVKIDVEGGELRVLQGGARLMASGRARFFVEFSWWGDRERRTSVLTTLRFAVRSGMRIERRLRSDYLLTPEPSRRRRVLSACRVLPALLPRYLFNTLVPPSLRRRYIRRQNERRLARFQPGSS